MLPTCSWPGFACGTGGVLRPETAQSGDLRFSTCCECGDAYTAEEGSCAPLTCANANGDAPYECGANADLQTGDRPYQLCECII